MEERVTNIDTEQAIRVLQEVAQKLDIRPNLDNSSYPTSLGPSYAEVASRFIPSQQPPQSRNLQSRNPQSPSQPNKPLQKHVPTRYKREIIVEPGQESPQQASQSYKELIEQLNSQGVAGQAVAIRRLQSRDLIITMEDEPTRNKWLEN